MNPDDVLPDFRSFKVGRDFVFRRADGTVVSDWAEQIERVANDHGKRVEPDHLENDVPEGREPVFLRYGRVTADVVAMELPWLYAFHVGRHPDGSPVEDNLAELANRGRGGLPELETSGGDIEITINILRAPRILADDNTDATPPLSDSMDWHKDFNPQVALLYTSSRKPEDGGAVVFDVNGKLVEKYPRAGEIALLDAHSVPHCIAPLSPGSADRFSVALNLNLRGVPTVRPTSYFAFVYGEGTEPDATAETLPAATETIRG